MKGENCNMNNNETAQTKPLYIEIFLSPLPPFLLLKPCLCTQKWGPLTCHRELCILWLFQCIWKYWIHPAAWTEDQSSHHSVSWKKNKQTEWVYKRILACFWIIQHLTCKMCIHTLQHFFERAGRGEKKILQNTKYLHESDNKGIGWTQILIQFVVASTIEL